MQEVRFTLESLQIAGVYTGPVPLSEATSVTLALHGWLDNAASFYPLMPYLTQQGCLALDFPGHGWSSHRASEATYYFIEWAADLVALLEQQNWSNIHLIGHSMGGLVAQLVAALVPERIQSLTLIEAFGYLSDEPKETLSRLQKALIQRRQLQAKQAPIYSSKDQMIRLRAQASQLPVELVQPIVERNIQPTESGWSWRVDPKVRLSSPFRFTKEQIDALMEGIQCPTQLIKANQGWPQIKHALRHWQHKVPNLTVHQLEGGHHVHLEHPQQVGELIDRFVGACI